MLDNLLSPLRSLLDMRSIDPSVPILDTATLTERLNDGDSLVVLFYADWCGFCRAFTPTFEDQADAFPYPAAAINISDYEDPGWEAYNIENVPTVIAFDNGEPTARADGLPGQGLRQADLERLQAKLA